MTASEMRAFFLEKALPVIESVTNSATGQIDPLRAGKLVDTPSYHKVWELASIMMREAKDLQKIKANSEAASTATIIKAVCAGEIDIDTANKLMQLFKAEQDIELLPALLEQLDGSESD